MNVHAGIVDQPFEFEARRTELSKLPASHTTICERAIIEAEIGRVHEEIRKIGPEAFRQQLLPRMAARHGDA
jgi:hypothetical protein